MRLRERIRTYTSKCGCRLHANFPVHRLVIAAVARIIYKLLRCRFCTVMCFVNFVKARGRHASSRVAYAQCFKNDDVSPWNGKNLPHSSPNPLASCHPNSVRWLRHRYLPLCKIWSGSGCESYVQMRDFTILYLYSVFFVRFWSFLLPATIKMLARILTSDTSKHAVARKNAPFQGHKDKKLTQRPPFREAAIFDIVFDWTWKIFARKPI